jgi:hypothetical protein
VAFYFVKGKTLFFSHGDNQYGLARKCHVITDVEAGNLLEILKQIIDVNWLLMVTSPVTSGGNDDARTEGQGVRLSVFVNANTFPKPPRSLT